MRKSLLLSIFLLLPLLSYSQEKDFYQKLSDAAVSIIDRTIIYDPAYTRISYPNGDVEKGKGVCTDVVIRAYRKLGIDLQKEIHEDIKANFSLYPNKKNWGLKSPDRNIDHRRVPNQQVFFSRKGTVLPITKDKQDYNPGDIVTWNLGGGITHVGIVIDQMARSGKAPLVVHNIGGGQVAQDILFKYTITGHYRYKK